MPFFRKVSRLQRVFDLRSYEESKKLLIDAICEEAILEFERLKIWKGAALESDTLTGNVDYLIAENKAYLEAPLACIIEAKKDNFEQGLAQCLVEMQACQWQNRQRGCQSSLRHNRDLSSARSNRIVICYFRLCILPLN